MFPVKLTFFPLEKKKQGNSVRFSEDYPTEGGNSEVGTITPSPSKQRECLNIPEISVLRLQHSLCSGEKKSNKNLTIILKVNIINPL